MKKQKILISALFFVILSSQIYSQRANSDSANQAELETILKKCAEYCEKLSNSVLYFVCREKIKEEIYFFGPGSVIIGPSLYRSNRYIKRIEKNNLVYDYQLVRKDKIIKESRVLLEENGQKKNEKNAPLKTKVFRHKNIILGPIGLLSEYWQKHHDYKIFKKEKYKGEEVIVIEAFPKPGLKLNHLFGKIWVRKSDFSILKIEWNQTSIENYEKIEEFARQLKYRPSIKLTSEYAYEKNGIRFPSKYSINEAYVNVSLRRKRITKSKKTVIYEDYKFFTVETEVKY